MKKILYLITIILFTTGCQDEILPASELTGEWKLIQSHHYTGTELIREGEDLEWDETYIFEPNGTFQKIRTSDSGVASASGVFTTEEAPLYLARPVKLTVILTFKIGEELAVGCHPSKEEMEISSHDGLLRNYSISCENPIFTYMKE